MVAEYIRHFSRKGEVVLDPFCGSGVTGIEAIVQDRTAYLVDLNPIATFITKATAMVDFNPYELKRAFGKIAAKCQKRIQELYSLDQKCSICNGELETRHLLRGPKFETPIVQAYCSHCGRKENLRRELTQKELSFLNDVESKPISSWYPEVPFLSNFDKDRVTYEFRPVIAVEGRARNNQTQQSYLRKSRYSARSKLPKTIHVRQID